MLVANAMCERVMYAADAQVLKVFCVTNSGAGQ